MGSLDGKTAIVSAAGRGIGRGIALALAEAGANVARELLGRGHDPLDRGSRTRDGRIPPLEHPGDVTDPAVMLALKDACLAEFGSIDILVNNVGAGPKSAIEPDAGPLGPTAAMWDALYSQNLRPVVLMTEAVLPVMREAGGGKIINVSSIAGRAPLSDTLLETLVPASYGAMKAALISYTQALAEIEGKHNINVNAVCPGIVYTDAWVANARRGVKIFDKYREMEPRAWFEGIARGDYPEIFPPTPLRREQTVEDIGNAVVFLTSDASLNITGQSLMVDGGMIKA